MIIHLKYYQCEEPISINIIPHYHNESYSKFLLLFIIIIIKLISHVPGFGARLIVAFLCGWLGPCTSFPLLLNNFFEFHFNDGNRHMFLFVWFFPLPPNPSPKTGKEKQDATERNGDAMEQGVPLSISWKYCLTDHNANTLPFLWSISSFSSCPCFHSCLILIHSLHSSPSGIFKTIKSYHSYENLHRSLLLWHIWLRPASLVSSHRSPSLPHCGFSNMLRLFLSQGFCSCFSPGL